jgi:uncharacterized Zn finger protein (UPF0148 family)
MGKKNRQSANLATEHVEKRERLCDWCRLPSTEISPWNGQHVCAVCFDPEDLNRKKEEKKKRQEAVLEDIRNNHPKKHKNKYAHYSQFDKHLGGNVVVMPKPRRKNKKPRLKKVVYWTVIITDITDGKL